MKWEDYNTYYEPVVNFEMEGERFVWGRLCKLCSKEDGKDHYYRTGLTDSAKVTGHDTTKIKRHLLRFHMTEEKAIAGAKIKVANPFDAAQNFGKATFTDALLRLSMSLCLWSTVSISAISCACVGQKSWPTCPSEMP